MSLPEERPHRTHRLHHRRRAGDPLRRDPALLEEGRAILAGKGRAAGTVPLDVTRPADAERGVAEADAGIGVDILVANAGIAAPRACQTSSGCASSM